MKKQTYEDRWGKKDLIRRATWTVIVVVLMFSVVLCVKILGLSVVTDVRLNSETVLAYIIAFFSLWLSIMFYFKTEESSNRFYDNTYKFTSDISTALAEVKSEFGEHLKNLDKGYEKIADTFSFRPEMIKEVQEVKKSLEEAQAGSAQPKGKGSRDLLEKRLKMLQKEIQTADKRLTKVIDEATSPVHGRVMKYTRRRVIQALGGEGIKSISDQEISHRFKALIDAGTLPAKYIADLKDISFIDEGGYISKEFMSFIRSCSHKL